MLSKWKVMQLQTKRQAGVIFMELGFGLRLLGSNSSFGPCQQLPTGRFATLWNGKELVLQTEGSGVPREETKGIQGDGNNRCLGHFKGWWCNWGWKAGTKGPSQLHSTDQGPEDKEFKVEADNSLPTSMRAQKIGSHPALPHNSSSISRVCPKHNRDGTHQPSEQAVKTQCPGRDLWLVLDGEQGYVREQSQWNDL